MFELDHRLKVIASFIEPTSVIADIGTDHAYLPIYLIKNNLIRYAYACDIGRGPIENAQTNIDRYLLNKEIETRLGSGLQPILEVNNLNHVIIAGMGGKLISKIMEDTEQMASDPIYILEPNAGEPGLRRWLSNNKFQILDERIVKENNKIYEIIITKKSSTIIRLDDKNILFGPFLLLDKNNIFKEKWQKELYKKRKVLLERSKAKQTIFSDYLSNEIRLIEEVIGDN